MCYYQLLITGGTLQNCSLVFHLTTFFGNHLQQDQIRVKVLIFKIALWTVVTWGLAACQCLTIAMVWNAWDSSGIPPGERSCIWDPLLLISNIENHHDLKSPDVKTESCMWTVYLSTSKVMWPRHKHQSLESSDVFQHAQSAFACFSNGFFILLLILFQVTETRTGPLGCSSYDNLDSVSSILLQSPESKLHLQGKQAWHLIHVLPCDTQQNMAAESSSILSSKIKGGL